MTTLEAAGGSFDFGRVVQRTFRVIADNSVPFLVAALVLVSLPAFVGALFGLTLGTAMGFTFATYAGALVAGIGGAILQGAVVFAAINKLNGRSYATGEILRAGLRFALPLIGLAIVSFAGFFLGFLLLVVPGLILCTMWSVAAPSLITEKRGVFASLQRSRDLTRGNRWSIFGLLVIYFILSLVVSTIAQALGFASGTTATLAARMGGAVAPLTPGVVFSTLLTALANGFQSLLAAAGAASLYYELRSTKEGLAPDQLASVFD